MIKITNTGSHTVRIEIFTVAIIDMILLTPAKKYNERVSSFGLLYVFLKVGYIAKTNIDNTTNNEYNWFSRKTYKNIENKARLKATLSLFVIFFSQFLNASITIKNAITPVINVHQAHGHALSQICIKKAIVSIITNTIQLKRWGVVFLFNVSTI